MKVAFKSAVAAAAFIVAGAASAATVIIGNGPGAQPGVTLVGVETLKFSADALAWLDTIRGTATAAGSAKVTSTKDTDGYYTEISSAAPMTNLTIDDTTNQALSAQSTGGVNIATPVVIRAVTSGGSLSITDVELDVANKRVYATVIGANGVGTVTHVYMWDAASITNAKIDGTTSNHFTASGLSITSDAYNKVVTALGLLQLGKAAAQAITDYGSIDVDVTFKPTPLPVTACAVSFKSTKTSANIFKADVTMSNLSSNAATDWKVNWVASLPMLALNVKNAKINSTNALNFTATPVAANKTIAANGSTTFSFRGHTQKGQPTISGLSATLGGQTCAVSAQ